MNIQRAFRTGATAVVCAALLVTACRESLAPSRSGPLTVHVSAAAGPGAAFKVMVIGEGISEPVVANAGDLLYSFASNDTLKVAVIGEYSSGPLFRFSVPDRSLASSYTVVLLEVAGSDNALLTGADFTLTAHN
ncbi:MAG: hypothetical protein GTO46_12240 [Gemmatimonadetes bacterium]|nr:hypothetical protein [Gemmatimonadota bacterium]NIO32361.1 hypothetical protein [Gemmatimonadota bacterium]